ncbi:TetR/AcrR family transcriptional regulator [Maribellus maritimus]|uniref:TetR/AcrR family transcriptional regulator n=1 Tax=Maribellus maritimus TaxID=2870838 RepID=UPI001EEB3A46|nr:TetR/AcrR family transcriptional regulator [Maribellus maritimus]MCG6188895.1 TetR/AcrR family transcriptional regulator [Maribellus maritimus]
MNEIKKDNAEEKILNAAQNVFIKKGMDGARMQEIADEAGINKALLHYYFRTKEKLFDAIFKKVFSKILPNLMDMVYSDLPIEKKLGIFVESYIDLLMKNPFLPTFILKEMNRNPDFLAKIIKGTGIQPDKIFAMFKKEMEAGRIRKMDPRDLLVNILGLSIFPIAAGPLMTIMFFENDKEAYKTFIERRKKTITEFILHSILIK